VLSLLLPSLTAALLDVDSDLFWKQGFLVFRSFASQAVVATLRASMDEMLQRWEPGESVRNSSAAFSPFRSPQSDISFMLSSATQSSFFLEVWAREAFVNGELRQGQLADLAAKRHAVRKVAHALHLQEGPMRSFTLSPDVAWIVSQLGLKKPVVVQSLYRLASGQAPGVDRHQDSTTLYTEPPSVLGLWLALEDTDEANGCLRLRPGSHNDPIRERLVRRKKCSGEDEKSCKIQLVFEQLNNSTDPPDDSFEPMVMAAGDLLVMHGSMDHLSFAGTDAHRSRESYQVHIVDADARWAPDNWLQYPPGMEFMALQPPLAKKPRDEM